MSTHNNVFLITYFYYSGGGVRHGVLRKFRGQMLWQIRIQKETLTNEGSIR